MLNSPHIGGGNSSMFTLWDGIQKIGVVPVVVYPRSDALRAEIEARGLEAQPLDSSKLEISHPIETFRSICQYDKIVRRVSPDLIHANSLDTARLFSIPARLHGIPLVCHIRYGASSGYVRWVFRWLPKPRLFVFNSHALREQMEPVVCATASRSRIAVVYNAVDTNRFMPHARESEGPRRVAIVANLLPVKDHETFLRMASVLVKRMGKEIEFFVIGADIITGGRIPILQRLASELGIDKNVIFLGYRRNVHELLVKVDVLVCSSTVEPFGRSLIEAMAVGRPVVATRVGGVPEVVTDGVTGFLVDAGDYVSMAVAVERLLTCEDLWNKMARAAIDDVSIRFGADAHARVIRKLYDDLLTDMRYPRAERRAGSD